VINLFFIIIFIAIVAILFVKVKNKWLVTVATIIAISTLSSIVSFNALFGQVFQHSFNGSSALGPILVKIDALSAWFILVINFTFITGSLYGLQYMKQYAAQKNNNSLHCIALIIAHSALTGICSVQNAMVFLIFWEFMALSACILVIFEHSKATTLKAGINYLIQSHVSIVFIMLGFMYVAFKTGSYSFTAITEFSLTQPAFASTILFFCFFIAFAIKAGFVPFHTWLPYAHPAAPAHVSGIMSGVIIKIGIYGILRMLLLIKCDYSTVGYIILLISLISGIYGVMLAIIQHDLKRLLAYHSIENIGIIGIGIGIGSIGIGIGNNLMTILGFSGALLHVLNHSLFKSLLFYSAGNVYQSTHTLNIERLGGIGKYMPHTAFLFLIAALAICGLPPLNGFISEFLIYGGLYNWLLNAGTVAIAATIFSILGLVIIGGLAMLCFTKAFGIVFLGNIRQQKVGHINELKFWQLLPMYLIAVLIVVIGLFSPIFIKLIQAPVLLFTDGNECKTTIFSFGAIDSIQSINYISAGFIAFVLILFGIRELANKNKLIEAAPTWGCGYANPSYKLQYTASSFVKSLMKLTKPFLAINKNSIKISSIFPAKTHHDTHPYDKLELILIDKPLKLLKQVMGWFLFLQRGRLQQSILYGIIFIAAVISIPMIIEKLQQVIYFLNHL
jgi:formate hydrogenlyase subunit 3/multisubunit Na+/H+ antiporter MnhD subunit